VPQLFRERSFAGGGRVDWHGHSPGHRSVAGFQKQRQMTGASCLMLEQLMYALVFGVIGLMLLTSSCWRSTGLRISSCAIAVSGLLMALTNNVLKLYCQALDISLANKFGS